MYIAFAPLQGYTDCIYRRAHHECVGGVDEYYTPFVRIEHGEIRKKDLRDIDPERNSGVPTVPQVIAKDGDEFARLCDALQGQGWQRIDINMGCPFPMQVKAGRGSGLLQHPDKVEEILREMQSRPEVTFSVKMRLGMRKNDASAIQKPNITTISSQLKKFKCSVKIIIRTVMATKMANKLSNNRYPSLCMYMVVNGD